MRDGHPHDEVGGVPARGQHALALGSLVDRALVEHLVVVLVLVDLHRLQPNRGHGGPEHLRERVLHVHVVVIPPRAVHEEAVDVRADAGVLRGLEVGLHDLEVPRAPVDGDLAPAGKVLEHPGQERLLEEVRREPERVRDAVLDPGLHELPPVQEIKHVRLKRLQRGVRHAHPGLGHLVGEAALAAGLQVRGEDHKPLHRLAEVDERVLDDLEEAVELTQLHVQHRVEALLVHHWVLAEHSLEVADLGQLRDNLGGHLREDLLVRPRLSAILVVVSARGGAEGAHQADRRFVDVQRLVDGSSETGVLVQPERLWCRADGQRLDVVEDAGHRAHLWRVVDP
mmetsp:Transcript_234/g.717  ORF Transcript_234/g.717 Transcript_234/m.717 type:complete len:340 (-) Transcript_234:1379-2398(-)